MNYCPLAFMEESGRNRTPDKLPPGEREQLFAICDEHLREVIGILEPQWIIGVGDFAAKRARDAINGSCPPRTPDAAAVASLRRGKKAGPAVGQILHPSPACPASNNKWDIKVTAQLQQLGVW